MTLLSEVRAVSIANDKFAECERLPWTALLTDKLRIELREITLSGRVSRVELVELRRGDAEIASNFIVDIEKNRFGPWVRLVGVRPINENTRVAEVVVISSLDPISSWKAKPAGTIGRHVVAGGFLSRIDCRD
ncbi:hypothetical protein [Halococcus sp. IIIV-5B]|uniref:hypothetical protein n=1 Tax=Halococcus sp. IIIV-5B TaxID=2321230 RepID=UPI0018F51C88|nr:hypothetical protein [Halococcus sp. IIIV-5B]